MEREKETYRGTHVELCPLRRHLAAGLLLLELGILWGLLPLRGLRAPISKLSYLAQRIGDTDLLHLWPLLHDRRGTLMCGRRMPLSLKGGKSANGHLARIDMYFKASVRKAEHTGYPCPPCEN